MNTTIEALNRRLKALKTQLASTPEYLSASRPMSGSAVNYLATHPAQYQKVLSGGRVTNPAYTRLQDDIRRLEEQLKRALYLEGSQPSIES